MSVVKSGKAQNEHIMSAPPPKADIDRRDRHVRFVPKADSCSAANPHSYSITSMAHARSAAALADREAGSTSGDLQGIGDLFTALRRQGLIADELVLQLTTFLRSLDLLLELIVVTLTPRALTANQVRHGGKQGTDNSELSRIHCSAWPALTALPRSLRPKVNYLFNVEMICRLRRTGRAQLAADRSPSF